MNTNKYIYNLGILFNEVANTFGEKTAIKFFNDESISYKELNILSNKLANFLLQKGVKRGDVIAILNNKTQISYAIMLASLKIGGIYTNLDPKSPSERFAKMIATCQPKIIFYYNEQTQKDLIINEITVNCLNYTDIEFIETINNFSAVLPISNQQVTSNTPAYIMFTSGSTGFPKGVVISHANVLNFIEWTKITYQSSPDDVFTNINPLHFDNSVFDFYASLFTGASLIAVSDDLTKNPRKMLDALNPLKPTIWFSVPSMLVYVLNMRALKLTDLPELRIVTFGGEGFPKNQLRNLWSFWGNRVQFINVYGPTECTCICSSYIVSESDLANDELLPLGIIAPNFYDVVVNETGNLAENNEIGELWIGGENVGIGYFNNVDKTKDVFINNHFITTHTERVYKSGDLVKKDDQNILYFCGRKDNQIKRMGYRIELEEIETALNSINYISEAAVVYITENTDRGKIIACICSDEKNTNNIIKELQKLLPSYMIPDSFVYYEELPKNQNGKIDRLKIKSQNKL